MYGRKGAGRLFKSIKGIKSIKGLKGMKCCYLSTDNGQLTTDHQLLFAATY
jgi:hypothetical protein